MLKKGAVSSAAPFVKVFASVHIADAYETLNYQLMKINNYLCSLLVAFSCGVFVPAHSQEYFSRLSMEGVDLFGTITYGEIDEYTRLPVGLYRFDADNAYRVDGTTPLLATQASGGCAYHDGKIYCNEYDDVNSLQSLKPMWRIYDASTYALISETELRDNCECTTRSMTYDPVSNKIYGFNYTYTETYFVEIEPETGSMTRIGGKLDYDSRFLCIASNARGQLYCVYLKTDPRSGDQTHYLAKIQKSTGKIALVGELKPQDLLPGDLLINMKYKQSLFFDNAKNKLYWMFGSSSMSLGSLYTAIVEVGLSNTQARLVAYLAKSYHVSGAFFKEPEVGVPSVVSDFVFEPVEDGAVEGHLKFMLPETTYNGLPLGGDPLTVIVEENGQEILHSTGMPGELFDSGEMEFSNDRHTVNIKVANAIGASPVVSRDFYAGYDVPGVCQNIRLTAENLTTTLTWDEPIEGINGAIINPSTYTYNVIRWPGETTVATNLKERIFVETHPEEMIRYVYAVVPCDGNRQGKSAFSNNYIVGVPLDPPYGGIFKQVADMYNYYTILDENKDNCTWNYDRNTASAFYDYSIYNDADDWLVSPPINYKQGKEYVLKFKAYSSLYSYPEAMEVKFGSDRHPQGQTVLLLDVPAVPSVDEDNPVTQYEVPFRVEQDGVYHYSFHAYTERYHEYLFIFDIRVAEQDGSSLTVTKVDAAPIAVKAGYGCISVENPMGEQVAICDVDGRLVVSTAERSIEVPVSSGVYIVASGTHVQKLVVF